MEMATRLTLMTSIQVQHLSHSLKMMLHQVGALTWRPLNNSKTNYSSVYLKCRLTINRYLSNKIKQLNSKYKVIRELMIRLIAIVAKSLKE